MFSVRKKILIVAPFCSLPGEPYFNRFFYLANMLCSSYCVTLVTSNFRHFDKSWRSEDASYSKPNLKIVLIEELGYTNNVSVQRLRSHGLFCKNFESWLANNFDFDLVYSAYPLIQTNIILAKYKKMFGFRLVIDVQDVWPESISSVVPFIAKIPYYFVPFSRKANRAYNAADALIAVSRTYLERALKSAKEGVPNMVVYLGSSLKLCESRPASASGVVFKLVYLGTLSFSYDVETVARAVDQLVKEGYKVEFHVLGGGPFEKKLKSLECRGVFFHGFMGFEKAVDFMRKCNVAVNAIAHGAPQSVTNKLSDYLALGIPLINSQENAEVRELILSSDHENYKAGSVESFKVAFKKIYNRKDNLKYRPSDLFNRDIQYKKIGDLIGGLIK